MERKPFTEKQATTPKREDNYNRYTPKQSSTTPNREDNYSRYTPKYDYPKYDKENREKDPYVSFVEKSMKKYDYGKLPHENERDYKPLQEDLSPAPKVDYKRTSYTPENFYTYGIEGAPQPQNDWENDRGGATPDAANKRYPCKSYILTGPQNPVPSHLQYTPYKGMNYPEMISKIREDRSSDTKEFVEHEKMRKVLQRTALKHQGLISNQKCEACI